MAPGNRAKGLKPARQAPTYEAGNGGTREMFTIAGGVLLAWLVWAFIFKAG